MRTLLIGCLYFFACDGSDCMEPGGVPVGGLCDLTARASVEIDDVFEQHSLSSVTNWIEVIWVDTPYLEVDVADMEKDLYGRAWPSLDLSGPRCLILLATRKQTLMSETSLAHEMLHCSFVVGLDEIDGDMNHSNPDWDSIIPEANARLKSLGM